MKKSKLLWSLMALPLLAACSHDDLVNSGTNNGEIPDGDGVYMSVNIVPFNKGTRSYTDGDNHSNDGVEVGTEAENNINNVLIVLADENNKYIASAEVKNDKLSSSTDKTIYQAKAKFSKTTISEFYSETSTKVYTDAGENVPVRVFIYCNPSAALITKFQGSDADLTNWTNWTYDLASTTDAALWTGNNFPMTNVSIATRYFPSALSTWNMFSVESNPFDLSGMNNQNTSAEVDNLSNAGSINVHRMAARFDFRDGSQGIGAAAPSGNGIPGEAFTYSVMENSTGGVLVKAKLVNMSLVNVLKNEYYLERVTSDPLSSTWSTTYSLLGAEKKWFSTPGETPSGGNYVVSPNADSRGNGLTAKDIGTYYMYPFFDAATGKVSERGSGWYTKTVEEVCGGAADENYGGNYHIWRYVTENTLGRSSADVSGQVNSSSTGIIFKAQLSAGEALKASTDYWDQQLALTLDNTSSNGPVLYAFSNNLYCSWEHLQYAALAAAGFIEENGDDQHLDKSATLYKYVFGDGGTGTVKFHMKNGDEITFTDYERDADGNLTTTPVEQDTKSPNYFHAGITHVSGMPNVPQTSGKAWEDFRDAVVANDFTIYEKYGETTGTGETAVTTWGYFCYYYYWNRHNDNKDNASMAPMEFAVVRNNVYKLAVINLKTLGHPRIPDNDPDTPTPDTPDEKADVYMTVSVQVVPWVVRVNDISF